MHHAARRSLVALSLAALLAPGPLAAREAGDAPSGAGANAWAFGMSSSAIFESCAAAAAPDSAWRYGMGWSAVQAGYASGVQPPDDSWVFGMGWSAVVAGLGDAAAPPDDSWVYGMGWSAIVADIAGAVAAPDPSWRFGMGWSAVVSACAADSVLDAPDDSWLSGLISSAMEGFVAVVDAAALSPVDRALLPAGARSGRPVAIFAAPPQLMGVRLVTVVGADALPPAVAEVLDDDVLAGGLVAIFDPTLDPATLADEATQGTRVEAARAAVASELLSARAARSVPSHLRDAGLLLFAAGSVDPLGGAMYEPPDIDPFDDPTSLVGAAQPLVVVLDPAAFGADVDLGRGGLAAPRFLAAPADVVLAAD